MVDSVHGNRAWQELEWLARLVRFVAVAHAAIGRLTRSFFVKAAFAIQIFTFDRGGRVGVPVGRCLVVSVVVERPLLIVLNEKAVDRELVSR